MSSIVDFSDIEHIQGVVASIGGVTVEKALVTGIGIVVAVAEERSKSNLEQTVLKELEKNWVLRGVITDYSCSHCGRMHLL